MAEPVRYHSGEFPPKELDWPRLIPLIGPANAALARYDGVLSSTPNAAILMSPLTTQEAVLSSRIEGTQATITEVLEFEADESAIDNSSGVKRGDIKEVLNYRRAMHRALELLKTLPLSQRIVKEAHRVLLEDVRGRNREPGEYRRIQNWIGPEGCSQEEAYYIPIATGQLSEGMGRWEKYIHDESACPDNLVRLALLHLEFEALHPFLDGNGRLGRMFIPLYLFQSGVLSTPMFYISAFFERNRDVYYERLRAVSRKGVWTEWCMFFLEAILSQANENLDKAQAIRQLYDETTRRIAEITHSQYAVHASEFLFKSPIFKASDFYTQPNMTLASGRRMLNLLQEKGFFREIRPASGRRPAILAYRELLNTAEGQKVF
jgi:Fic family protein